MLLSAGAVGAAAGLAAGGCAQEEPSRTRSKAEAAIPFHGEHQAGIATVQQRHLQLAAFDLTADDSSRLRDLLMLWSSVAAQLVRGRAVSSAGVQDPGEAADLAPARLTITIGLGPTLFERQGRNRLGLLHRRPPGLEELPRLRGEQLQPELSGGDLCLQVCSDDAQVAFHALHTLSLASHGTAVMRWAQAGFTSAGAPDGTPRNLMGFKDGTKNVDPTNRRTMDSHVWVPQHESHGWMAGGTYLVMRRIRMLLDVWDGLDATAQARIIGRSKDTGAPLGAEHESDPVDLDAQTQGAPTVPIDAHIRLAAPQNNGGARLLRRGYSYSDGVDPYTGQLDAGLVFLCYQRNPHRQFAAIQRKLSAHDALRRHTSHTASALFACPPGARASGFVGEGLFT